MTDLKAMKFKHADADDVRSYITDDAWWMQQKVDGMRAQLRIADTVTIHGAGGGTLKSTTGRPAMEQVAAWFRDTFDVTELPNMTIDGEVVAKNGSGVWWMFDITMDEHPALPYSTRTQVLTKLFEDVDLPAHIALLPVARTTDEKDDLWQAVCRVGAEGVIVKKHTSKYRRGKRVTDSLKIKRTHTIDVVVLERGPGNGKDGEGNWLRLGIHKKNGELYEVGRCSTIGKPHADAGDVIEVKYLYTGRGGRLVQPTHLRNRPDKEPTDCTTEQLVFVSKKVVA